MTRLQRQCYLAQPTVTEMQGSTANRAPTLGARGEALTVSRQLQGLQGRVHLHDEVVLEEHVADDGEQVDEDDGQHRC